MEIQLENWRIVRIDISNRLLPWDFRTIFHFRRREVIFFEIICVFYFTSKTVTAVPKEDSFTVGFFTPFFCFHFTSSFSTTLILIWLHKIFCLIYARRLHNFRNYLKGRLGIRLVSRQVFNTIENRKWSGRKKISRYNRPNKGVYDTFYEVRTFFAA